MLLLTWLSECDQKVEPPSSQSIDISVEQHHVKTSQSGAHYQVRPKSTDKNIWHPSWGTIKFDPTCIYGWGIRRDEKYQTRNTRIQRRRGPNLAINYRDHESSLRKKMRNTDVSKSEFGKKLWWIKNASVRKRGWTRHTLWQKLKLPEKLWKNMHKLMRSCAGPMNWCRGTCTAMADVPLGKVPRTCHRGTIQNRYLNKSWKSLCRPIISHPRSLFFLV